MWWHTGLVAAVSSSAPTEQPSCQTMAQHLSLDLQTRPKTVAPVARIAIIIDDLGYHRRRGLQATALPGPLTLAILPHSPYGQWIAQRANDAGKEVMVHLPMSSVADNPLDKGGLTHSMDHEHFLSVLRSNLAAIPEARGANNHMGSLLTQQHQAMQWLMDELWIQKLYFVDSRTSAHSVAGHIARQRGLPVLERQVFLDNERNCATIAQQFLHLERVARRRGQALAIGHPYPETLDFLAALLPHLTSMGLLLVPVSELLPKPDIEQPIPMPEPLGIQSMKQTSKNGITRVAHDGAKTVE